MTVEKLEGDRIAISAAAMQTLMPKDILTEPIEIPEAWSIDEENYCYDSLYDLIENNCEELVVGQKIHFGRAVKPAYSHLCDADDIIEMMSERAYEIAQDYADNFPDVDKDAIAELNAALQAWQEKHCPISFYTVHDSKEYILTAEDLKVVSP